MKTSQTIWMLALLVLLLAAGLVSSLAPYAPQNDTWHNSSNISFAYHVDQDANCTLFIDGLETQAKQALVGSENTFHQNLSPGTSTWWISCNYTDGNTTNITSSDPNIVHIDTLAPTVEVHTPAQDGLYKEGDLAFLATYLDDQAAFANCTLNYTNSSAIPLPMVNASNTSLPMDPVPGTYDLWLSCPDHAGNRGAATASFTVMTEPDFTVQPNQPTYALAEEGAISIYANNGSNVTLQLTTPTNFTYTWNYLGETYPKIEFIPTTNFIGTYHIVATMDYYNESRATSGSFDVLNNIVVDVDGDTTIDEGETVDLEATAEGGIPPLQVHWVKEDGSVHASSTYERTFQESGSYDHKVRVTDSQGNVYEQPVTIKVKRLYRLIIYAKDKDTNANIADVELDVDGAIYLTDGSGKKELDLRHGDYDIRADKDGYSPGFFSLDLAKNQSVDVFLEKIDETEPTMTLETADGATLGPEDAVQFKVDDQSKVSCSFFVRPKEDNWYVEEDSFDDLDPGQTYSFRLDFLDAGTYFWKVSCIDEAGNEGDSQERALKITTDAELLAQQEPVNDQELIQELEDALDSLEGFSGDQNRIALALDYEKTIKLTLKRVKQIQRDINTLVYRKDLTEQEIEQQLNALSEELDGLRSTTPLAIDVEDTKTFVKYTDEDVLKNLLALLQDNQQVANEKNYIARNVQIQSLLVTKTTLANVELTHLDGSTAPVTLVWKQVSLEDDLAKDLVLMEYIPKEIATTTDEVTILTDHSVVAEDPIISFGQETEIAYYLHKRIDLDELGALETFLFDATPPKEMEGVTGSAIFDFDASDPKIFLVAGIALIILIYLFIAFDLRTKCKWFFLRLFTRKQLHYIHVLINDSLDFLEQDEYEKASFIYDEIKLTYEKLSAAGKEKTYAQILDLIHRLDVAYLDELYEKLESHLKIGNTQDAIADYRKIEQTYKGLDKESKKRHYQRATELYQKIAPLL